MRILLPTSGRRASRRGGFALLMALVLIALAACAMTRMATGSLQLIQRGTIAQRELQEKWALVSCRMALVDRTGALLGQAAEEQMALGYGWPFPNRLVVDYELAGKRYHVELADEDAKLNLNSLAARRPEKLLPSLSQAAVYGAIPLRLRPHAPIGGARGPAYTSWGQVVELARLDRDEQLAEYLRPLTQSWTCWGTGKTNVQRATDETLRLALEGSLPPSEVEKLLEARRGYLGEWDALVESLDIPRRHWVRAKPLLGIESTSYSGWISEFDNGASRSWLVVYDPTSRQWPPLRVFPW